MPKPLILALDQGTTSTRAILFDREGRALGQAARPLAQSFPRDGWVEHDAEEIARAAIVVLGEAVARSGRSIEEVSAIGIANQRETVVVWSRADGRPIHPAIVWQDRRTADACQRLRDRGLEAAVVRRSGLLLDPYFSATKIAWLLDRVEGARTRALAGELAAGTIDSWLVWRLTRGRVHATDPTNASRTLLMDLERQAWSEDLCRLFDVPPSLLPQIRDTADDFGETDAAVLGRPVSIRALVGDQQAALMGQGCVEPGGLKATYGTGCFLLKNTGEAAPRSRSRLLTTVASRTGGRATYALEGSIFIAGAAIQWLGEGLGLPGGPAGAEAAARRARPGHEVVMAPAFTGLGAPHWDAEARGAIMGLTRDAGLPEIAAAAFDACALQTRELLEAMAADAPDATRGALRIDGGMASSRWFAQRLADLTGIEVRRADFPETTALGAAMFAGLASGVFESVEAAAAIRPEAEVFAPSLAPAARDAAYARWRDAVARVRTS